jgi:molecular chaperone DnaK (HSP70)
VYTDRVFGIDFGTTRTVVACADRGNHPVVDFVDDAGDARGWIPSMVAERDGELRFGFDAAAVVDDPSFTVARSFKRLVSGAEHAAYESVRLGRTEMPVGELVTRFLVHAAPQADGRRPDPRRRRRPRECLRRPAPDDARRLPRRGL